MLVGLPLVVFAVQVYRRKSAKVAPDFAEGAEAAAKGSGAHSRPAVKVTPPGSREQSPAPAAAQKYAPGKSADKYAAGPSDDEGAGAVLAEPTQYADRIPLKPPGTPTEKGGAGAEATLAAAGGSVGFTIDEGAQEAPAPAEPSPLASLAELPPLPGGPKSAAPAPAPGALASLLAGEDEPAGAPAPSDAPLQEL